MTSKLSVLWLTVSTAVVCYDAAFILLRPHTLRGGDLHSVFSGYDIYLRLDKNYGDVEHTFTVAQAWGNLFEVCLNMATVTLILLGNRGALLCGFLVNALTCYKTVLYLLQYLPICNGSHLLAHLAPTEVLAFFALSGVWVVIPGLFVLHYGVQLMAALRGQQTHTQKKKK